MHAIGRFAFALCLGLVLVSGASGTPMAAEETEPRAVVERLNETLLAVMREAGALGYEGRMRKLEPVLRAAFDFPQMARISAGRHWSKLSDAQRSALIGSFARMSIATFASRFDGYSGERFEVVGTAPGPRGSILVRNNLVKSNGEAVAINYLLQETDGQWRVSDVYLDGIYSELATKRAEYSSVLSREGFDALIARMAAKVTELEGDG